MAHDRTAGVYDPEKIRPARDFILVLMEPRKTKVGLIELPVETGAEKVTEGAGRVVAVGPGEKNHMLGLEKGQRILYRTFLKHANPLETGEFWDCESGERKEYFFMSSEDIMAILPPGLDIGVYSGRPMSPEMR